MDLSEIKVRSLWMVLGIFVTWFTCYWFTEELIFLLVKPLKTLSLGSHFMCTKLTEALYTNLVSASMTCCYFVFPFMSYQVWSVLVPLLSWKQSKFLNSFLLFSFALLTLFLFLTYTWAVPSVWKFLGLMSETSTNSFVIKLEPSIYDYVVLTFFILFISSMCSQMPLIAICLLQSGSLSVETLISNRSYLLVFFLLMGALLTPPDIWCQILAFLLISSLLESIILLALILQIREYVWSSWAVSIFRK